MATDEQPAEEVETEDEERLFTGERAKAFVDAVVAIAMTLLILPLTEALGELKPDEGAAHWFANEQQQLLSFGISFALIGMFWINHHRLFARVDLMTIGVLWLNVAWLATIVWLPVATAMSGRASSGDAVAKTVYIGSMIVCSALLLVLRLYVRAHPEMHRIKAVNLQRGIAADISLLILFAASLALTLLVPSIGYFALALTSFTGLLEKLISRRSGVTRK